MKRVYIAACSTDGPVKIGVSRNPEKRLRGFMASTAIEISFASEPRPEANAIEMIAHRRLAERRLHGEWFNVTTQEAIEVVKQAIVQIEGLEPPAPSHIRIPRPGNTEVPRDSLGEPVELGDVVWLGHASSVADYALVEGISPDGVTITVRRFNKLRGKWHADRRLWRCSEVQRDPQRGCLVQGQRDVPAFLDRVREAASWSVISIQPDL